MHFIDFVSGEDAQCLKLAKTETPKISDQQVLVKVRAFGINRADTLQRQGKYPPPKGESAILGLEVAGEVVAVAQNVTEWKVGDHVFGLVSGGGYAEYVAVHQHHLMAKPAPLSFAEAAGVAEVFLTAFQSLFLHANITNEDKVLVHAGASAVGLAAIQLASHIGADVAVTASSAEKLNQCDTSGANLLLNYKEQAFEKVIKEHWQGVDIIIDFVGGDYLNRNLSCLNIDGRIVYLAMLAGRFADKLDMALLLSKRASIIGSTLRNRDDDYKSELVKGFSEQFLSAFESGRLVSNIDTCYTIDDVATAHSRLEENQSKGKLVVVWDKADLI